MDSPNFVHKAVGEVTRGGFSSLVNLVEDGSVVILSKFNEPVAVVSKADRDSIKILENSFTFGKILVEYAENKPREIENYLLTQVMLGLYAETLLVAAIGQDKVNEIKTKLIGSNVEAITSIHDAVNQKNYSEEVGNAEEQPIAPSNEEEGVQSVSPTLFSESNQTSSAKRKTSPRSGVRKGKKGA
ncbi:MAG TPA: hypothetical protein PJ987_13320 [Bacteroidia bacterium]|nr:hypothetical protein [Bacteroidia bacterium]